jgi:hypothetical protein
MIGPDTLAAKERRTMTIRNLDKIFQPRSIAIVGASDSPGKVGHTLLQNALAQDFAQLNF